MADIENRKYAFKKVFAILVLSGKLSAIRLFIKQGVEDGYLPLRKVPVSRSSGKKSKAYTVAIVRDNHTDPERLGCFKGWTLSDIRTFEEWQWMTLAPFFHRPERKNVGHFVLQDQIPLPFTSDSRLDNPVSQYDEMVYSGCSSSVSKVEIHPEHHALHRAEHATWDVGVDHKTSETRKALTRSFAIKRLLSRNRDEFNREAETLIKFSGDVDKHLISLQATFEQHKIFYLVFLLAQCDLRAYWKKNPTPHMDLKLVRWVARQCSGIASGLSRIHRYESSNLARQMEHEASGSGLFGRHGDIKPENIVWFDDDGDNGTLKITDFGLTEFKIGHSTFSRPRTSFAISPSYRPPECDQGHGVSPGRSSDIWALDCLYLELITWLIGGWALLVELEKRRESIDPGWYGFVTDCFFEIPMISHSGEGIPMVKEAVTQVITHSISSLPSTTAPFSIAILADISRVYELFKPTRTAHNTSTTFSSSLMMRYSWSSPRIAMTEVGSKLRSSRRHWSYWRQIVSGQSMLWVHHTVRKF